MKRVFIGLFFIFITITVNKINFTPDWVGYALIFWGLSRTPDSPGQVAAMTVAVASAVLSGVLWVVGLFGYGMAFPLGVILQLFMTYRLLVWCEGLEELEGGYQLNRLRVSWYALVGAEIAAVVLGMFLPPLGWVWSIAGFAAAVFYLYTYYRLLRLAPPEYQD